MEIYNDINDYKSSTPSSVTIGKFDGLHLGHQGLLESVTEDPSLKSIVLSFDIFPVYMLSAPEKMQMLMEKGVDASITTGFTAEFMQTTAKDFIKNYIVKKLHAEKISVGRDFRFGYGREGNADMLIACSGKYGFSVNVIDDVYYGGEVIRSSWIRRELKDGNISMVNKLLGYRYFITGEIVHGQELGRTLGFPTTNMIPLKDKLLPKFGGYVSKSIFDDREFYGVTNIGIKPTVGGEIPGVETYLLDCNEDLYGKTQKVELIDFIRSETKFEDIGQLKNQLNKDIETARSMMS